MSSVRACGLFGAADARVAREKRAEFSESERTRCGRRLSTAPILYREHGDALERTARLAITGAPNVDIPNRCAIKAHAGHHSVGRDEHRLFSSCSRTKSPYVRYLFASCFVAHCRQLQSAV